MPLVQDIVAHTFFEHQHITSVHQQSGSGHVKDEVGKLAEKNSSDETATDSKAFDSVPLHLNTTLAFHFSSIKPIAIIPHSFYHFGLPSVALAIQLPPPRA